MRTATRNDPTDVDLYFKFWPKSGISAAFTEEGEPPLSFPPKPAPPVVFLPLSEISIHPRNPEPGQMVTVTLPEWLAYDKGLI